MSAATNRSFYMRTRVKMGPINQIHNSFREPERPAARYWLGSIKR